MQQHMKICVPNMDRRLSYSLPGASGNRTFIISEEIEFASLQKANQPAEVIISNYAGGVSPNINPVITDDAVLLSQPSVQLIGIQSCTNWPSAYCGNDFSAARRIGESNVARIYQQTHTVGNWLREKRLSRHLRHRFCDGRNRGLPYRNQSEVPRLHSDANTIADHERGNSISYCACPELSRRNRGEVRSRWLAPPQPSSWCTKHSAQQTKRPMQSAE